MESGDTGFIRSSSSAIYCARGVWLGDTASLTGLAPSDIPNPLRPWSEQLCLDPAVRRRIRPKSWQRTVRAEAANFEPIARNAKAREIVGNRLRAPLGKVEVRRSTAARVGVAGDQEALGRKLRKLECLCEHFRFLLRMRGQGCRAEQERDPKI